MNTILSLLGWGLAVIGGLAVLFIIIMALIVIFGKEPEYK